MPRAGLDTEAVVSAAAQLADAQGLEALTLAALAARLGIRAPSLYAHVNGLPELRTRLAARGAWALAGAVQAAAAGKAGRDALRAVAATYRAYAVAHPGTYAAMQRAPDAAAPGPGGRGLAEASRALVDVLLAILAGYGIEADAGLHCVRGIRAALHGFVALEREGAFGLPLSLDDSYERLIAVLDRGLASNA